MPSVTRLAAMSGEAGDGRHSEKAPPPGLPAPSRCASSKRLRAECPRKAVRSGLH